VESPERIWLVIPPKPSLRRPLDHQTTYPFGPATEVGTFIEDHVVLVDRMVPSSSKARPKSPRRNSPATASSFLLQRSILPIRIFTVHAPLFNVTHLYVDLRLAGIFVILMPRLLEAAVRCTNLRIELAVAPSGSGRHKLRRFIRISSFFGRPSPGIRSPA